MSKKTWVIAGASALTLAGLAFAAAGGGGNGRGFVVQLAGSDAGSGTNGAAAGRGANVAEQTEGVIEGAYICEFRAGAVGRGSERAEAARAAAAAGGSVKHVYDVALQGFAVNASAQGVARMQANNPRIARCAQDQMVTLKLPVEFAARPGGGGGTPPSQTTPYGITRVGGGLAGTYKSAWVLDTGIDLDHPDLNVDRVRSINFVSRETSPEDLNGHGTHVAGTIAAINNGIGVIGVAPGAPVVAVRVLNRRGSGSYSDIIAGVNHVAANGAPGDVANMSLTGGAYDLLDTAVKNAAAKGIVFALAAGNDATDANTRSPARAEGPNIKTVSAMNSSDTWASFSNYNNPPVDWAAPGVGVNSTWLNGGYNTISGTSMAAPHVAGLYLLGAVTADGNVINDPDGNADPIAHH